MANVFGMEFVKQRILVANQFTAVIMEQPNLYNQKVWIC